MARTLIINLITLFCGVYGDLRRPWHQDIYSGRQFDDLVTQTQIPSPKVIRPAVLTMYGSQCELQLNMEKLGSERLPPAHYLMYGKHEYETTHKYIWYDIDARDDLKARYNPQKCLEFLYFANGTSHEDEPERYSKDFGKSVFHWIWDKFSLEVKVINKRNTRIMVEFVGQGPKLSAFTIEPESELTLQSFASYYMLVSDAVKQSFLYGQVLKREDDGKVLEIEFAQNTHKNGEAWFNEAKAVEMKADAKMRQWRWGLAEIYLHDFKQPVMLPKFTDLGYKKGTIPLALYKDLVTFYRTNKDHRVPEGNEVEPAINDSEIKCAMVNLPEHLVKKTAEVMKPLMEEWSNVTLEMSRLYGVREYFRGNMLRNHVDRISTHVVSVILQIDKDLEGADDWELEIIGFDGVRKNVTLEPGEMLFYESATLIHGRPFPYKGKVFANAFLHYKPIHGWTWNLNENGHWLLKDGKHVEQLDVIASDNMFMKGANMDRFVEVRGHSHDEL